MPELRCGSRLRLGGCIHDGSSVRDVSGSAFVNDELFQIDPCNWLAACLLFLFFVLQHQS